MDEPSTYSEDRTDNDEILEDTIPVNKAPSEKQSKDDVPPTPITKVADPGTAVTKKHPDLLTKIGIMNTRQGYDETIGRFVARLHALTNTSDPSTEYTKVDRTQDIVHMEPFILLALVKGLYDEATKNEVLSKEVQMTLNYTIAFVEARETDRQDAQSLGGMRNRCWRCGKGGHSGRARDYDIRKTSCDAFNATREKCNLVPCATVRKRSQ